MVKINNFFFLFLCLLGITAHAQKVSNVTFRQEQSTIIVYYDLETKTPCKISLFVSTDDGKTWQGPLKKVSGHVGPKIAFGNHSITWNVLEEFEELRGDKIKFQVKADASNIETLVIGTQEWTIKNLDVSRYRNGDIIPEVKDPKKWQELKTGAWCYYDNDPENGKIYGKLYNWYAVNDPRGLAPEEFHIPENYEMMELINYLGGEEVALDKLKKKGTGYFNDTATNSSGFTALAGGMYLTLDPKINYITFPGVEQSKFAIFKNMWQGFYCWTSSPYYLMPEAFIFSIENVSINETICFPKEYGLSVRCLRD